MTNAGREMLARVGHVQAAMRILRRSSDATTAAGELFGGDERFGGILARLETDMPTFNEHLVALGGEPVALRYPAMPSYRCIFGVWDMAEAMLPFEKD